MASSSPTILITGAEGFVGPYLIRELATLEIPLYATYLIPQGRRQDLLLNDHWIFCDLTDREAVFHLIHTIRPTFVYHLAGISFVPAAEANRPKAMEVNLGGTLNLLEALAALENAPRLVLISSGEVYGKPRDESGPLMEGLPLRPVNFYAATKAASEKLAWPFHQRRDISLTIFRPFNHIGPGQAPTFVTSDFARQVARITLSLSEPKIYVGDLDVYRDFTDVRDIVRGYRMAFEAFQPGAVYNLASGHVVSIRKILEILISFCGKPIEVIRDPARFRKAEVKRLEVSVSRFQSATGWSPRIPLKQTLREIYESWVEKLSRGPS